MSSMRFGGNIRGSGFNAGIFPPAPAPEGEAPQRKIRLRDGYYDALVDLPRPEDPKLRQELSELLGERWTFNQRIEKYLAAAAERAYEQIVEPHEEVKAKCREIQKAIADVKSEMLQLRSELATAQSKHERAMTQLHNAKQDRVALGRYSSDDKIEKADATIQKADQAVTKCSQVVANLTMQHNSLALEKLRELSEQLRDAEAEERDLSLLRFGNEGIDSLGFHHPART